MPARSAHIGSAATRNACAPLPRSVRGRAPMRQERAGGACSSRENSSAARTRGNAWERKTGALCTGCGAAEAGAQSECSTLPEESRVAAHSCWVRSPILCSQLCSCGAAERAAAHATAVRTKAAMTRTRMAASVLCLERGRNPLVWPRESNSTVTFQLRAVEIPDLPERQEVSTLKPVASAAVIQPPKENSI